MLHGRVGRRHFFTLLAKTDGQQIAQGMKKFADQTETGLLGQLRRGRFFLRGPGFTANTGNPSPLESRVDFYFYRKEVKPSFQGRALHSPTDKLILGLENPLASDSWHPKEKKQRACCYIYFVPITLFLNESSFSISCRVL